MSLRDTLLLLGYVLIAAGSVVATWALLTGPLGRYTARFIGSPEDDAATRDREDDQRT